MGGMRRPTSSRAARTAGPLLAAGLGLVLAGAGLAGCSGGGAPTDEPSSSSSPSEGESAVPGPGEDGSGATAYLDVPDDVELTGQGAVLDLGETAAVAWEPRADLVGALEVTVTEVVEAPLSVFRGWRLDDSARDAAAYFVTAEFRNVGDTDLSGVGVPLYALDGSMVLVQPSSFEGRFRPCPSGAFPAGFTPGAQAQVCQVYLLADDGDLSGVAFRPTEAFVPITWTGEVGEYDDPDAREDRDRERGDRDRRDRRDRERNGEAQER